MDKIEVPDVTYWPEIINKKRKVVIQIKESLGMERLFFHYDLKHPDPRFHKLMIRCMVLYLFGNEENAKSWLVYKDENGSIKNTIYSAILVSKNEWAVGKPEAIWKLEADRDEKEKLIGVTLSLDTDEGSKKSYFVKPANWQE